MSFLDYFINVSHPHSFRAGIKHVVGYLNPVLSDQPPQWKVTAARLREAVNGIGYRATARPPKKGRAAKPKAPACCGAESCDTQPPG